MCCRALTSISIVEKRFHVRPHALVTLAFFLVTLDQYILGIKGVESLIGAFHTTALIAVVVQTEIKSAVLYALHFTRWRGMSLMVHVWPKILITDTWFQKWASADVTCCLPTLITNSAISWWWHSMCVPEPLLQVFNFTLVRCF